MRYLAALSLAALASSIPCWLQAAPANDRITNATALDSHERFHREIGDLSGVTADRLPLLFEGDTIPSVWPYPEVWFKWTAPMSGKLVVQAAGTNVTMWAFALLGPAVQDAYPVVSYDSVSSSRGNDVWFTDHTYDVEAGETYFNGLWTNGIQLPAGYTYVQRFLQDPVSDGFSTRSQLGGTSFTILGNNGSFSEEDGEPEHGVDGRATSKRSAWMTWRSPEVRKFVSIDIKSTVFEPVVTVYTGEELATLKRVARGNLSASRTGNTTTVTFIAEDGVDYHIAVDGTKARAGAFTLSLEASTVRPGFLVQPASTTIDQGQVATFSATASYTGDTISYQWQRRPAGQKTWTTLVDDETFNGTQTAELAVVTSLDMNNDRYRVQATDSIGTSSSRAALLTVTEFPALNTEVLGTVNMELAGGEVPPPSNGGTYFASGLPRGLSIDPATGVISGIAEGKPGVYRVTYGSTDGKVKNPEKFILQIIVAPFAPLLTGSFEAIIDATEGLPVPVGKLSLKVATNGRYTGRYFVLADGKAYSFRGTLSLNEASRTAGVPDDQVLQISRGRSLSPIQLAFTLTEPSDVSDTSATLATWVYDSNDTQIGQSFDGEQIPKFTTAAPAAWAGIYTVRLGDVTQIAPDAEIPIPPGSGYATASITAKSGKLALRARLPDNTPFTASLSSSASASYRLGQRVHSPGGSIAGRISLTEDNTTDGVTQRYHVGPASDSRLYWTKPQRPKDRLYPDGFGEYPLSMTFLMEPWRNPGNDFPAAFGLSSRGDMIVNIVAAVAQDGNYALESRLNPYGLPIDVRLGSTGKLTIVDPADNPTKFSFKVNRATGLFTGSYRLVGYPGTDSTLVRKVKYRGVLFQPSTPIEGDIIGAGFAIVPLFDPTDEINSTSLIEFRAGPATVPDEAEVDL